MDDLFSMIKELDLGHIFAHPDEQVYARLVHIIWKEPDLSYISYYYHIIYIINGRVPSAACEIAETSC